MTGLPLKYPMGFPLLLNLFQAAPSEAAGELMNVVTDKWFIVGTVQRFYPPDDLPDGLYLCLLLFPKHRPDEKGGGTKVVGMIKADKGESKDYDGDILLLIIDGLEVPKIASADEAPIATATRG